MTVPKNPEKVGTTVSREAAQWLRENAQLLGGQKPIVETGIRAQMVLCPTHELIRLLAEIEFLAEIEGDTPLGLVRVWIQRAKEELQRRRDE